MDQDLTILSETTDGYIGVCNCCTTINFIYKNLAIKFKDEEFEYFLDYMNKLNVDDFIYESRTGKKVFMRSPVKNMVFCYSSNEIEEIRIMINEAAIMIETMKILK